jgi:hypothetical protein
MYNLLPRLELHLKSNAEYYHDIHLYKGYCYEIRKHGTRCTQHEIEE